MDASIDRVAREDSRRNLVADVFCASAEAKQPVETNPQIKRLDAGSENWLTCEDFSAAISWEKQPGAPDFVINPN